MNKNLEKNVTLEAYKEIEDEIDSSTKYCLQQTLNLADTQTQKPLTLEQQYQQALEGYTSPTAK